MEDNKMNEEILTTGLETPVNTQPVTEPVTSVTPEVQQPAPVMDSVPVPTVQQPVLETPTVTQAPMEAPVSTPIMEPVHTPVVEQPFMEPLSTPMVEQPAQMVEPTPVVEQPMVTPTPVVEPVSTPVVEQPVQVVEPTPVVEQPMEAPTPVVETPVSPSEEPSGKPSSILKVLLMILLIIAIMAGAYYVYTEYFAKPVEEEEKAEELKKDESKVETTEGKKWNALYLKDGGASELLLFANTEEKASLIYAEKVEVEGESSLEFLFTLDSKLDIKEEKLHLYDEEDKTEVITIEKNEDKVLVTYVGEEKNKAKYESLVGNYTKTKEIKSFNQSEFTN